MVKGGHTLTIKSLLPSLLTANIIMASDGSTPKTKLLLDSAAIKHVIAYEPLMVNIQKCLRGCRIFGSIGDKISDEVASMGGIGGVF